MIKKEIGGRSRKMILDRVNFCTRRGILRRCWTYVKEGDKEKEKEKEEKNDEKEK